MNEQLRRAVDEALNRTGMIVGLPKCAVDASQLKHLLDKYEAAEAKLRAVGGLPRFDVQYGGEEVGLYKIYEQLGDYVDADELEALLKEDV